MIIIADEIKNDPVKRWALPDEVFFAAGACHILAYAFLEQCPDKQFKPLWIKPSAGHRGNHIIVSDGKIAFDYSGFNPYNQYLEIIESDMKSTFYDWTYQIIEISKHVLISETESKKMGLWLREPNQFLHNALPRAEKYLANGSVGKLVSHDLAA
jgi:hypothetical protein